MRYVASGQWNPRRQRRSQPLQGPARPRPCTRMAHERAAAGWVREAQCRIFAVCSPPRGLLGPLDAGGSGRGTLCWRGWQAD